ncbi:MAG: hypothetical protein KAQ64_02795 [Candidatus Pacebacteria bacterium]|nr:hypothetical protein [Candidatus Paceibacterota bacterium]
MKNGAKIRTMQDDLKDIKNNSTKQDKQQKPAIEVDAKKIQQPSAQLNSTQPINPDPSQVVRSDMQQQPARSDDKQPEIKEKPVLEPLSDTSSNAPLIKPTSGQDDQLKELIKRISNETDKDSDSEGRTEKEEEIATIPQAEKKDIITEETAIVDELADENKSVPETKKEDISKETVDEPAEKEVDDKNTGDIDKLKRLIYRISKPEPSVEKKPENKIKDLEKAKEENIASEKTIPLAQEPEQNIQQDQIVEKQIEKEQVEKEENIASEKTIPLAQEPEQNIQQDQIVEKQIEKEQVEKEEITAPALSSKKPKNSFWKNISEKLKKPSDSEKINALSSKKKISDIKVNDHSKTKEFASRSGVLRDNKNAEQKEVSQKESLSKKAYYDRSYTPPNERLIHGKQKYYSSVSKRIKLKEEKDELEELKDATKIKKQKKIITKEDEYKKLKKSIIQKYHIKLFSLPWKRIILVSLTLIALIVGSFYAVTLLFPPEPPVIRIPVDTSGKELEKFMNLEKKIIIEKNNLKGNDAWLKIKAEEIFSSDANIKIIKLIIIDNDTEKNILSLEEALNTIGIIDIGEGVNHLPKNFLEISTNNYNLFIFQTGKNSLRYGLAVKTSDADSMSAIMESWEQERTKNKKMTSVLKPLFIDDKNFEDVFVPLSETYYKDVKIKYISLIDKETALDYFIYNDILVFATSKDSVFLMVDLMTSDE